MKRAYIAAVVVLGLAGTAVETAPFYSRLASSANEVGEFCAKLKTEGQVLSPIERFVFSLVLATTKASSAPKAGAAPARRT